MLMFTNMYTSWTEHILYEFLIDLLILFNKI